MAIGKSATDLFGIQNIGTGVFHVQSSSSDSDFQYVETTDLNGDVACVGPAFGHTTNYSAEYQYCGTTLGTDIALVEPGALHNSKIVTSISISTSNSGVATISVEGINFDDSAIAASLETFTWPTVTPALVTLLNTAPTTGKGCLDWFGAETTDIVAQSSDLSFSTNLFSVMDAVGDHDQSTTAGGLIEASVSYKGTVTAIVTAGWTASPYSNSDSNSDFDESSLSGFIDVVRD